MGWNEPEKGNNSWKSNKRPPDLDEALKRLHEKLKNTFLGKVDKFNHSSNGSSFGVFTGLVALVVGIIWALSGIFIVDPAEQAVILRFGKYTETVGPGPHWIPPILSTKVVMNVDRVMDYSYSAQMLTKDENLVSVSVAVQYRINDLQEYLFNVANPEESLQQATSSALRQVVGTTTLDQLITEGREVWGISVQDNLIKTLALYETGISIVNVSPQPARAPESVQDAFDDAIKAQEDEKRFKEQAYAYAAKVVPIAEGNASRIEQEAKAYSQQIVLKAKGEVARYLALLPQYVAAPTITAQRMYLDTMQSVFNNSSTIIVDSKARHLIYLPLEKLLNTKQENVPHALPLKKNYTVNSTTDEGLLLAGRDLIRPTYQQGE